MKPSISSVLALSALVPLAPLATLAPLANGQRAAAPMPTLELASLDSQGVQGESWSGAPALSASGRFVAFHSYSANLVAGDTNGHWDVFVHDRRTGVTERVSVGSSGVEANSASSYPSISADGRFVAFQSFATNLVAGDLNGEQDVFVRDRRAGVTVLASVSTEGVQGDAKSELPSLSADGRFVAFQSFAANLAPDPNGFLRDAFVHDLQTGTTTLVSLGHMGQSADQNCDGTTISGDGRSVAFQTSAGNLVPGDTNNTSDVFVRDRIAGTTVRASVDSTGAQTNGYSANASLSFDGRLVAFQSSGALVPGDLDGGFQDVYLHDLATGQTTGVTATDPGFPSNTVITTPSLAADGSRVAFETVVLFYPFFETRQVRLRDRERGETVLLSHRRGARGNDDSIDPSISADGRVAAFETRATNLVIPDLNGASDVHVHTVGTKRPQPRELSLK